ncbi:MAG TPA: CopD family protein [Saprospiraceae bacterium]|nr:CopD family protein [Saprospiraceae bacterium]HMP13729.1 CopD family protein [Saprospiraceae bacterium]
MIWISFFKALHVVGFVAWFAGLFYLGRMFVYHVETAQRTEPEQSILKQQFQLMQRRVYGIIANPAMMLTWTAGLVMLLAYLVNPAYPNYLASGTPAWMHLKLTLLVLLTGYHLWCKRVMLRLEQGTNSLNSFQLRLANEAPTLFLVSISFVAVYGKAGTLRYDYLLGSFVLLVLLLYAGAKVYQNRRQAK